MTTSLDEPSGHTYLDFNAPLSDARAADLIADLIAGRPGDLASDLAGASVLDLGCGWAELLLRILAAAPLASGSGVDTDADAIERGRANAAARGLAQRVRLEVAGVDTATGPADVVISIGASHAWGGTAGALAAVRQRTGPGGQVLFGDAIWDRPPTETALRAMDATSTDFGTLGELADQAMAAGFRVLGLATANQDEWDSFESRFCAGRERWLLAHPDDPRTETVRAAVDQHRRRWLHGYRGYLGFAYLTLARLG